MCIYGIHTIQVYTKSATVNALSHNAQHTSIYNLDLCSNVYSVVCAACSCAMRLFYKSTVSCYASAHSTVHLFDECMHDGTATKSTNKHALKNTQKITIKHLINTLCIVTHTQHLIRTSMLCSQQT
jgi:hypothetical protein